MLAALCLKMWKFSFPIFKHLKNLFLSFLSLFTPAVTPSPSQIFLFKNITNNFNSIRDLEKWKNHLCVSCPKGQKKKILRRSANITHKNRLIKVNRDFFYTSWYSSYECRIEDLPILPTDCLGLYNFSSKN